MPTKPQMSRTRWGLFTPSDLFMQHHNVPVGENRGCREHVLAYARFAVNSAPQLGPSSPPAHADSSLIHHPHYTMWATQLLRKGRPIAWIL